MITEVQKNNITKILGFSLNEQQLMTAEEKILYFFHDKVEYKINILHITDYTDLLLLMRSKNLPTKQIEHHAANNIIIIYTAPTPAIYHVNRKLFYWTWSAYDLDSGNCIYNTNNNETPDVTNKLYA